MFIYVFNNIYIYIYIYIYIGAPTIHIIWLRHCVGWISGTSASMRHVFFLPRVSLSALDEYIGHLDKMDLAGVIMTPYGPCYMSV